MKYAPNPMDISEIKLSDDLQSLIELISENTHETWAKARMSNGWKYGPIRNDAIKESPFLIPYDELPEAEKEYDRLISINVLKTIKKLGFDIVRNKRD